MALALDGSAIISEDGATASQISIQSPGITTSNTNDIIVVVVLLVDPNNLASAGVVSSVATLAGTGTVGSFTKRKSIATSSLGANFADFEIWWALASTTLTGKTFRVNLSQTPDTSFATAFAVSGADTVTPWDTNGSLPATLVQSTSGIPTVTGVSTSNANTMLLGFCAEPIASVNTAGSGYNLIQQHQASGTSITSTLGAQDKIVSSTQSSISVAFGSTSGADGFIMIADAIQAPAAGSQVPYTRTPQLGPIQAQFEALGKSLSGWRRRRSGLLTPAWSM